MVGPDTDAVVDEVLHPPRGSGGRRLYDAGRQPQRHRRLELEEPVEDPEASKADPEDPPGGRFRCGRAPGGGEGALPLRFEPTVLDRPDHVESDGTQRAEDENNEELKKERRVE